MLEAGLAAGLDAEIAQEVDSLVSKTSISLSGAKNLRSLLWSSIDNPDSRDLDQLEYAEQSSNNTIRVMVAIADVDSFVRKGALVDQHAFQNTTSVYTGVTTFSMLPEQLSFELTSLLPEADRQAIVVDLIVDGGGKVTKSEIYAALVRNHAKLDYIHVGDWLENGGKPPEQVATVAGLSAQLKLQYEAARRLGDRRREQGALQLHTIEARAIVQDGQILDLEQAEENLARELIENFMVSANIAVSRFLELKQIPSLRRIVKTPERWPRIVEIASSYGTDLPPEPDAAGLARFLIDRREADPVRFPDVSLTIVKLLGRGEYTVEIPGHADPGHFALAVHDYTHATAPNRRYVDLVNQRMLKAVLAGKPSPYSTSELYDVARQCTERENAAKKVERTMRKVAAAVLLSKQIGKTFDGIVTGVKDGATYVRLLKPPAEGRIVKHDRGLDVGDKVKVKLIATDPDQAYIDFERLSAQKPQRQSY